MPFLHLTNGSAVIPPMRAAGIVGAIVPWDDVLHEGPVPAGLSIAAMRETRAEFLASCGWGSRDAIHRSLATRDAALEQLERIDEIVLWFEHDLFDQLQLLQILNRLPIDGGPPVTAVPGDDYLLMPGLEPGPAGDAAGDVRPGSAGGPAGTRFAQLFAARRGITSAQRLAARDAWEAFRADDPRAVLDAIPRVTDLPHLPAALHRHLQQFPAPRTGLSRTEQQTLEAIARGIARLGDIFTQANHHSEEAVFMGDAAFLLHVRGLLRGPRPLMARTVPRRPGDRPRLARAALSMDDELTLADDGRRVLAGEADRVTLCGIDRWLGGVHLEGHGPVWRWHHGRGAPVHL